MQVSTQPRERTEHRMLRERVRRVYNQSHRLELNCAPFFVSSTSGRIFNDNWCPQADIRGMIVADVTRHPTGSR